MKKTIPLIIAVLLFTPCSPHCAEIKSLVKGFSYETGESDRPIIGETKTFIKEYTYQASDEDSKNSSRVIALREAKRLLLEELGTYLESITEVKNFQLTKDRITALTAGIAKTEIIDEKWDGHTYWLKLRIVANSGELISAINSLRKDRERTRELEELKRRSEELLKENESLREELAVSKGKEKQKNLADSNRIATYNKNVKELTAIDWLEKGSSLTKSGNYKDAIDAYSQAIELNPENAKAYRNRGVNYAMLANHNKAIKDLNKFVELSPKDAADAYVSRGIVYAILGSYDQSIKDLNKAIALNPKDARAYRVRGDVHVRLVNYKKGIEDYTKAIKLSPKDAGYAYNYRGLVYERIGNYSQAIKDLNKAIALNPKNANAYFNRAIFYANHSTEGLVSEERVMEDVKSAARLGHQLALAICGALIIDCDEEDTSESTSPDESSQKTVKKAEPSVSQDKPHQQPEKKSEPSIDTDRRYKAIKAIVLQNGDVIEGQVISINPDIVKIRTKDGKVLSYDFKKEVQTFIRE
ncbi:MAG: tetratricopeptide repeat protein [Syntrophales bacterium]